MKRLVMMIAAAVLLVTAASCEKYEDGKPSKNVRSEFNRMYPDAWDVEWEWMGGLWEVSFETGKRPNGTDRKAYYDADGTWIRTVTDVLLTAVPQNIKDYLQESEFGTARFEDYDAEYFETSSGDDFYRFDMIMDGREIEVDVNENGEVTQAQYGYF